MEQKYLRHSIWEIVTSIITFDKYCSEKQFFRSLKQYIPCYANNIAPHIRNIVEWFRNFGENSEEQAPVPICEAVVSALSCFKPNQCLSENETDLLKDLAATDYDMSMKMVVEIQTRFGSFSNFLKLFVALEDHLPDESLAAIDIMVELIMKDYEVSQKQ